jgi:hypothetical protein
VEENVFTNPAVAAVLSEKFVEARLHIEAYQESGGQKLDDFLALRTKFAESPAMPTYAVIDPTTGARVGWHQLVGGPTQWTAEINNLLDKSSREAEQQAR